LTLAGSVVMLFGAGGLVYAALSAILVRRLGEPGLARGGGISLRVLHGIALGSTLLIAVAACLVAGLGFYMLHNTLQVNCDTDGAPTSEAAASRSSLARCSSGMQSA
jgi:hypothetical protein